jgi:hypothetical protein
MGLWPTQGEEKRLLGAQTLPFVIPSSAAQWRDLRFRTLRGNVFFYRNQGVK